MAGGKEPLVTSVALRTKYVGRALEFYQVFGLAFRGEKRGECPVHYTAKMGNMVFEIHPARKSPDSPDLKEDGLTLGICVSSLAEILEALKRLGKMPVSWEEGRSLFVRDPDGRLIKVQEGFSVD